MTTEAENLARLLCLRAKEYAMKIRDRNATLYGDETCYVMPSGGLEVVGEDGRTLFSIELEDGILKVQTGTACKHGGKVLDNRLVVIPHSANYVSIARPPYEA